jgi:endonuclease III
VPRLNRILDELESFHGRQTARWPTDPYAFLVWWHCGYPASEERCARGWESLNSQLGISPEKLLAAPSSRLARVLRPGGMIPELRAARLQQIARRVHEQLGGDLRAALSQLPLAKTRALLKSFPGIADPGADRILLFGEIVPLAAVPSSAPQVLVRIESGRPRKTYNENYRDAQRTLEEQTPDEFSARTRAYLLLQRHGQQVCKRTSPRCSACPIATSCAFFTRTSRAKSARAVRD